MLLARIAETSEQVAGTSARRGKIALLSATLAQLTPDEVPVGVAYLAGQPPQGRIGVGYAALRGLSVAPAQDAVLPLLAVDAALERIAGLEGAGSGKERLRSLAALFAQCTAAEQRFLERLLIGELRQGALEAVLLDAVAQAFAVSPALLRRAFMLRSDLGLVARAARERGEAGLHEFRLQLLTPLSPMLAQTAADPAEALQKLGAAAALEWKLDGARVQVHRDGDEVRVWTRALNDVTAAVPELVELVRGLPARKLVLDGEVIALMPDGRPRTFQTTMRRFGRRLDVGALRAELPLSTFFFDVLHADGEDVIDQPASERARILGQLVPESSAIPRLVTADPQAAVAFFERALGAGHEGIMAKSLAASYEAGRRGGSWLKIKRAHTLDLVVLAAEWGSGRRKGFLSNLHLSARGAPGEFVMLGKTFKGMTDEMLAFQTRELLAREIAKDAYTVYVRPELVVEVAFDGIQQSSQYPGGIALRFARIKRYRLDKRAQDADTLATVRAIGGPLQLASPAAGD